jgi:FAD/FMN-containing dehydrogenase/Fe-S oxidoreductase
VANRDTASIRSRDLALERQLAGALEGEVAFDAFTRGRYATDASIYQIMPAGVAFPKTAADLEAILKITGEHGVAVIMRGAGTSQNGQPIGSGLIVDCSRYLDAVKHYDPQAGEIVVEPGIVLERLNTHVQGEGLFFPVEPSTASRCTLGGMAANNSCGARSLRYGKMVDNVTAISGLLADGEPFRFAAGAQTGVEGGQRVHELARRMLALAVSERDDIERVFPKLQRRVGGYNLDELLRPRPNLPGLLIGSEGTLAAVTQLHLQLARLPAHRVLGICHFPTFRSSMQMTQHIVRLEPTAVELIDHNVLSLGAQIPQFRRALAEITRGQPQALLLVEFAGEQLQPLEADLARLTACMADHGFPQGVVAVTEPARQRRVWQMREACLNIVVSMKGDGKPVSFIEDCAVPLEALPDYTDAVTELFSRHGTRGTWYAHASVGCLHVRPILNMKDQGDIHKMRAIAEAACELVKRFKGSYSGEHGDGISRSEFIAPMFGAGLTRAFEAVKDGFDPHGRLNPGKLVRPYRMDDRSLMRFGAGYQAAEPARPVLDWSEWGGFGGAVEMCNNNGACRQFVAGTMCPSYRTTRDEQHGTRGRANTLRLAISGQLGPGAFTDPAMKATLDLCVSCKGCKRDCPTGVDMARMKIEFLHHYYARHGRPLRERLIGQLPRYASAAAALAPLMNLRDVIPGLGWLSEKLLGFSARRTLPRWRKPWREGAEDAAHTADAAPASPADVRGDGRDLVLFGDTFNRYFEPENLAAAERVLRAAGYRLHRALAGGQRPLCCGRTFLAVGDVANARREAQRTLQALGPLVAAGARIVGLEPSCLLTFRDEFAALLPAGEAAPFARAALLFEELLAADLAGGGPAAARTRLALADQGGRTAHLHGHCHQKAFDAMSAVHTVLGWIPGLVVKPIEGSCCGMAGAFGYGAETFDVSMAMAQLSLLPALRQAGACDLIVADGTSCRHQIRDSLGREALHVARVLDAALVGAGVALHTRHR